MASNPLMAMHMRISELERRLSMTVRHGRVAEVNEAEGWARLDLGEGDAGRMLSPKLPYGQMAGALKVHAPPSVGQTMTMIAPGGDFRQAIALPMTWSNANESPGDTADPVLTYGDVKITLTEGGVRIEVGGFELLVSGAGLAMAGGGVGHNGQDIGSTHRHPDVLPGPANTGTPIAAGPTP
ncbi:hypothetical protein [Devosia ginsengisoli]|uniref:hypothetical protein n=1 Tax=Devosia ginsengisoli TaxID=400770 RepID=UPI0026F30247|nr:hypothetical protein [Devosia ginsengisoli]MCR6673233.1 hypothetical protein [Devosia ginsengisoli]